jgi:hypothetical protein
MAILSKGTDFSTGDQVTAAKLNALVDSATFASTAVDDVSTALDGSSPKKIIVKDGGISTARLADSAVTTAKIADSNVTKAKIENVANMKALGNTSGSASAPQEVAILDEDTMSSNSATSLATQQSIKAYVDAGDADPARAYESLTNSTVSDNVQQNTTGRPLWTSFTLYASGVDINFLLLEVSPNSDMSGSTRIGQSRISSEGSDDAGTQVTGIVPSNYYWKYAYSLDSGTPTEMVHSSFIL